MEDLEDVLESATDSTKIDVAFQYAETNGFSGVRDSVWTNELWGFRDTIENGYYSHIDSTDIFIQSFDYDLLNANISSDYHGYAMDIYDILGDTNLWNCESCSLTTLIQNVMDEFKNLETTIQNDGSVSSNEKEDLLKLCSIGRYSTYYIYEQSQAINNPWEIDELDEYGDYAINWEWVVGADIAGGHLALQSGAVGIASAFGPGAALGTLGAGAALGSGIAIWGMW